MRATDSRPVPVFGADITTGLVRAFLLASLPAGVHEYTWRLFPSPKRNVTASGS